jgi:hypothetical protein
VLAVSFERVRDNRGGARTTYYATRVKSRVLLGQERANTRNHEDVAFPDYPRTQQRLERWFRALRKEEVE